jgi:putative flippase GtrA
MARFRSDSSLPQLGRFALVGGLANGLYLLLFATLHPLGSQQANLVGAVVPTVASNQLHRRLTFHADQRVGWWAAQWHGTGLALAGILASTAALVAHGTADASGLLLEAVVIGAVNGVVGLVRFLALRWAFRPR